LKDPDPVAASWMLASTYFWNAKSPHGAGFCVLFLWEGLVAGAGFVVFCPAASALPSCGPLIRH
ncbi:hypothetical protein AB9F47_34910, partial [Rhizobium leguminosarum]|uniref:hypothetical protein n=1 Tax=Rhizobium leguminosarum TaxID=384 RepID=UPI003F9BCFEF